MKTLRYLDKFKKKELKLFKKI